MNNSIISCTDIENFKEEYYEEKLMALLLAASMVVGMTALVEATKTVAALQTAHQKFPVSTMRRSSTESSIKGKGYYKGQYRTYILSL